MSSKIMMFNFKKQNTGFTLVETLVAISIFTISILGLMSVMARGVSDTSYVKQKVVAGYLAQEGIEYVRNKRDTDVLYPGGGDWGIFVGETISYPVVGSDFSGFTRTIQKSVISADAVKISSTVTWTQGSGQHSVTFTENLFNWWQ